MACPKAKHFHVICRDVFEKDNFERVVEVANPNLALEAAILELPSSWEGALEVRDDSTLNDRGFPLLDFWRTPLPERLTTFALLKCADHQSIRKFCSTGLDS